MVCKQWRALCRIGRDGQITAKALVVSLAPFSRHVDPVRVAMRASVITEGKEHVFSSLFDMWATQEGQERVASELSEPRSWTGESLGLDYVAPHNSGPGRTGAPSWIDLAAEFGRPVIAAILVNAGAGEGLMQGRYNWGSLDDVFLIRSSPIHAACRVNTEGHSLVLKILARECVLILIWTGDPSSTRQLRLIRSWAAKL